MEQRKRLLSKELIAFKKNAVIVENLDKDFSKKPKEEILDFFSERPYVVALQNELMNLGYMIELNVLAALTEEDAKRISCNVLSYAQDLLGADHDWKPLYGGFPAQVQDMSEIELLIDQIVHYMSMGTWMPSVPKKYQDMKNKDVFDCPSYVTLKGISYDDFLNIFYSICGSKNSITPFDKESIEWFLANKKEELDILTMSIPFKENLCIFLDQYPEFVESSSTTISTPPSLLGILLCPNHCNFHIIPLLLFILLPLFLLLLKMSLQVILNPFSSSSFYYTHNPSSIYPQK